MKEAEEEKKRWKELRRKKIKNLFEENMNSYETFEIMKRRFHQYKEGIEVAKRKQKEVELMNKKIELENKLKTLKKHFEERKEIEANKREKDITFLNQQKESLEKILKNISQPIK